MFLLLICALIFVCANQTYASDVDNAGKVMPTAGSGCQEETLSSSLKGLGLEVKKMVGDAKIKRNYVGNKLESVFYNSSVEGIFFRKIFYEDGKIVTREEEDRNLDGKTDKIIRYFPAGRLIKKVEYDDDHDGKFEMIEEHTILPDNPNIILIVTKKLDVAGNYAVIKVISVDKDQKSDVSSSRGSEVMCVTSESIINRLSLNATDVTSNITDGFYKTSYGYNIHQSCLDKLGESFVKTNVKLAFQEGVSCLVELAGTPPPTKGASVNLTKLENILTDSKAGRAPAKLICNETKTGYDWSGTVAHASTGTRDVIATTPAAEHPNISINPRYNNSDTDNKNKIDAKYFRRTIFHEFFHNMSYRHGSDVEYAYACEECCMEKNTQRDYNYQRRRYASSCRVCAGKYTDGMNDLEYLKDVSMFLYEDSDYKRAHLYITNYKKSHKKDRYSTFLLAKNDTSKKDNVFGLALAKHLKDIIPTPNQEESALLNENNPLSRLSDSDVATYLPTAEKLVKVYMTAYHEQNYDSVPALFTPNFDLSALVDTTSDRLADNEKKREMRNELKAAAHEMFTDLWFYYIASNNSSAKNLFYQLYLKTQ
ncbi:MAG: hypothetical protein HQK51_01440 [Oligoflexia bacterium]|nr:hypothetical protein [Oligoflexia bacterium]